MTPKTLCSAVTLFLLLCAQHLSAQTPPMGPVGGPQPPSPPPPTPPSPPLRTLRQYVPYRPLREADVMWSKRIWRTIDLREKFNHPIYYPEAPTVDRISLFDLMKEELLKSPPTMHAFSNPALDDEFRIPMTPGELEALFSTKEVRQTEDPNNPGTFITDTIISTLGSPDVKQFWVKEDWFLDKQSSIMDVRILGLCPLKEKVSESGEVLGYSPLFWIYFPEWRQVFAQTQVFNAQNNYQRISYDDLFLKRMFQSYIHKESNVYDRSIQGYTTGLDALLESDRIKDEIFRMEHDLWHF